MRVTLARRVATLEDIKQAGDYSGPHLYNYGEGAEGRVVWFLLPGHRGKDKFDRPDEHSGLHGVYEPPWTFRECDDGSLEIRNSIACGGDQQYWHGYLDEGNTWREL